VTVSSSPSGEHAGTPRHTVDTLTSDALDQLYDRLATEEADNEKLRRWLLRCSHREAIDRVRALADQWENALAPDRAYARALRAALDGPAPASASPAVRQYPDELREKAETDALTLQPAESEAVRQMDADTTQPHTGLVVQPYREHGVEKWVFRCWGTDTCDGWLSLDHTSEQSATRDRDRHVTEEH